MTIRALLPYCSNVTGPLLFAVGVLLAAGGAAQAQLNPQELLKQVLPGTSEGADSSDSDASSERACQRYAEKQGGSTFARSTTFAAPARTTSRSR